MARAAQATFIAIALITCSWCVATCGIVPMPVHVSENLPPCHQPTQKGDPVPCGSQLNTVSLINVIALMPDAVPATGICDTHVSLETHFTQAPVSFVPQAPSILRI